MNVGDRNLDTFNVFQFIIIFDFLWNGMLRIIMIGYIMLDCLQCMVCGMYVHDGLASIAVDIETVEPYGY